MRGDPIDQNRILCYDFSFSDKSIKVPTKQNMVYHSYDQFKPPKLLFPHSLQLGQALVPLRPLFPNFA